MLDTQDKCKECPTASSIRGLKVPVFVCSTNVVLLAQKAFDSAGYRFNIREDT